jgi:Shikimate 5'-dehydrogenase C-terminal domain
MLTCLQTAEKMGITTGSGFDMLVGTGIPLITIIQSGNEITINTVDTATAQHSRVCFVKGSLAETAGQAAYQFKLFTGTEDDVTDVMRDAVLPTL